MQPLRFLENWLFDNANAQQYLFSTQNIRALFSECSDSAFRALLARAHAAGVLTRVCRGIYVYPKAQPHDGLLLFHTAALLRANAFNYLSLETVLSEAGVISQIPINHIFVMSSGRTNHISCGRYGNIEFVHTEQRPAQLLPELEYDERCGMWRASVVLAMRDMRRTGRSCDLVDWDYYNELI